MTARPIRELEDQIDIVFRTPALLTEALTHRSYHNEHREERAVSYERLEFLGDAIVEMVVREFLFTQFPSEQEGRLTEFRRRLVSNKVLAEVAEHLRLGDYLRMSEGEQRTGGRTRPTILADLFEALIGAVYLDQGMGAARLIVEHALVNRHKSLLSRVDESDNKSILQEITQRECGQTPWYRLVSQTGPDHQPQFVMDVLLGNELLGRGEGSSRKAAEVQAATKALQLIERRNG